MRRCVRCSCWKPDASFLTHDLVYRPGRCDHCRSILKQLKNNSGRGGTSLATRTPKVIEKIVPTPKDAWLASVGREELRAYVARGARRIGRPYTSRKVSLLDTFRAAV